MEQIILTKITTLDLEELQNISKKTFEETFSVFKTTKASRQKTLAQRHFSHVSSKFKT